MSKDKTVVKYDFVCADTETTGLNSWPEGNDEIVEIAATEFNLNGERGKTMHFMCEPKSGNIPAEVSAVNNIHWEDVKGCPNYIEGGVRDQIADFITDRTLVGHNIDDFDLGFMLIQPKKTIDTLKISRKLFKGHHNLKAMCKKVDVEWDSSKAHRATYDVDRNIELFLKLKEQILVHEEELDLFMDKIKAVSGITPLSEDVKKANDMTFSYSRLNSFHRCKLKWYYEYLRNIGRAQKPYFIVGSTCHSIAEKCGKWCHREKWITCYNHYSHIKKLDGNADKEAAELYDNRKVVAAKTGFESFSKLYNDVVFTLMEHNIEIEGVAMPPIEVFNEFVTQSMAQEGCSDPDSVNEVDFIMQNFFRSHDFRSLVGEISVFERKMAVDAEGKPVDFYSNKALFRGVSDVIDMYDDTIIVTDYKSSRTMLSEKQLEKDMQTKVYLYLLSKIVKIEKPDGTLKFNTIICRMDYLRFNRTVELKIVGSDAIKSLIQEVEIWIKTSIDTILAEASKKKNAFIPERNEYCSSCDVAQFGYCNLYNNMAVGVEEIEGFLVNNTENCKKAWKQIEKNKVENSRLLSDVKDYMKFSSEPIVIDDKARLNFYTSHQIGIDTEKLLDLLRRESVDDADKLIRKYSSMSKTNFLKLMKRVGIKDIDNTIEKVQIPKKRTEFKALTKGEIASGGYLNV